jgi:hypothetical protein
MGFLSLFPNQLFTLNYVILGPAGHLEARGVLCKHHATLYQGLDLPPQIQVTVGVLEPIPAEGWAAHTHLIAWMVTRIWMGSRNVAVEKPGEHPPRRQGSPHHGDAMVYPTGGEEKAPRLWALSENPQSSLTMRKTPDKARLRDHL